MAFPFRLFILRLMTDAPTRKTALARQMRKGQNLPEWLMWERLKARKDLGVVFRRQHAFGPYIFDFYCFAAALCVEIDGTQHGDEVQSAKDQVRDQWLKGEGIEVYRIPAAEVLRNADGVADGVILLAQDRINQRKRR